VSEIGCVPDFCRECLRRHEDSSASEKAEQRGSKATGSKKAERLLAGVHAEEVGKERRPPAEGVQSSSKECRVPAHEEEKV